MCPKSGKPPELVTPADAPAAPLPVAEDVRIGDARKKENIATRGTPDVTYRRKDEGMTM